MTEPLSPEEREKLHEWHRQVLADGSKRFFKRLLDVAEDHAILRRRYDTEGAAVSGPVPEMAALAEQRELHPHPALKWDGNLSGGQWVPLRFYRELQAQRDDLVARLAGEAKWRDSAVVSCTKRQCSLMEQTIREQRELNNSLAFANGGMKWEIGFVRRLLRRLWSSVSPKEDEMLAQEVVKYLAGIPVTEEES